MLHIAFQQLPFILATNMCVLEAPKKIINETKKKVIPKTKKLQYYMERWTYVFLNKARKINENMSTHQGPSPSPFMYFSIMKYNMAMSTQTLQN
jgi:hypothetical protein